MSYEIKNHPLSVTGKYYVDCNACIDSGCYDIAPHNFKLDANYIAYVYKQPETPEEEAQCKEAKDCCPTAAIYDDGE